MSQQDASRSQAPHPPSRDIGLCIVCGASFKINPASGLLHKHGHGRGRPPCQGSGQLPRAATSTDPITSAVPGSSSSATAELSPPFSIRNPSKPTLNRLRALLASPDDLDCWDRVVHFADCLSQPSRGGKHHNLTSQIMTQIDCSALGLCPRLCPTSTSGVPIVRSRGSRNTYDVEEGIIRRTSAKF